MSCYPGPRLKKHHPGDLPGLTRKTPKSGSNFKINQFLEKRSNIIFIFKKNKNCVFIMVRENGNYLDMYISLEKQKAKRSTSRFYYNYMKCVWIISFFDLVWLQPYLGPANL
ncbi:hypothetical protein VPH35_069385 [Triticum aestivum]